MKNKYIYIVVFLSLFLANSVSATVGGPIFINDFKYNSQDESVYYTYNSYGGRGCPPELKKISLTSGQIQTVFSCEDGDKLMTGGSFNISLVNSAIDKITANYKSLTPINLNKNNISVDIDFVDYKKYDPEIDEIQYANFIASVYQNNKKVADFPITGCNLEQPFTFAGYAIPGFDKKIVLLLSAKGDCWEGGYIYENLYVVGGLNNLDKTVYSNYYKNNSALVPNEGTLTVLEADEPTDNMPDVYIPSINNSNTCGQNSYKGFNNLQKIIFGIAVFFGAIVLISIGIVIGKLSARKPNN